jgi:hypothetical protein
MVRGNAELVEKVGMSNTGIVEAYWKDTANIS